MTRSEFLKDRIANAERNLAKPNVRYQNGRMSHDVEREVLGEAQDELFDMQIDGYYNANGSFAGYADEPRFAHLQEA